MESNTQNKPRGAYILKNLVLYIINYFRPLAISFNTTHELEKKVAEQPLTDLGEFINLKKRIPKRKSLHIYL